MFIWRNPASSAGGCKPSESNQPSRRNRQTQGGQCRSCRKEGPPTSTVQRKLERRNYGSPSYNNEINRGLTGWSWCSWSSWPSPWAWASCLAPPRALGVDTKVLATLARFAIVAEVLAILVILFMFKSAVKLLVLGDCTMLWSQRYPNNHWIAWTLKDPMLQEGRWLGRQVPLRCRLTTAHTN